MQEELRRYREALDAALPGQDVLGFRAPMFSLDSKTHWTQGVLNRLERLLNGFSFAPVRELLGV